MYIYIYKIGIIKYFNINRYLCVLFSDTVDFLLGWSTIFRCKDRIKNIDSKLHILHFANKYASI